MVTSSLQLCTSCGQMKECGDTRPAICIECQMLGNDDEAQQIADQFGAPLSEVEEAGFEGVVDTFLEDSGDGYRGRPRIKEDGSSCGAYIHSPPEIEPYGLITGSLVSPDGRSPLHLVPQTNRDESGMPLVP